MGNNYKTKKPRFVYQADDTPTHPDSQTNNQKVSKGIGVMGRNESVSTEERQADLYNPRSFSVEE